MADTSRELAELRREIVESRNQVIKTDNQMKNLILDVKSFEKRFGGLEKRTRLASGVAHAIVAVTVSLAAYSISQVYVGTVETAASHREKSLRQQLAETQKKVDGLNASLKQFEEKEHAHRQAAGSVERVLSAIDGGRETEAINSMNQVSLEQLTELERRMVSQPLADFSSRAADSLYRSGRTHLNAGRLENALADFKRSLKLAPEGRFSGPARYLLSTKLWEQGKFGDAIPVLEQMLKHERDRAVLDEVHYLLGSALAHSGQEKRASVVLTEAVSRGGRYVGLNRTYLAALKDEKPLPTIPGLKKGRRDSP